MTLKWKKRTDKNHIIVRSTIYKLLWARFDDFVQILGLFSVRKLFPERKLFPAFALLLREFCKQNFLWAKEFIVGILLGPATI